MNILFHYESLAIGGQQTQTLNILKEIHTRNTHSIHFIYHYEDGLAPEYSKYCDLVKIPVVLRAKDYILKPWKLLKIIYSVRNYISKNKIDVVISGSGLGSVVCGIAARLAGVKHFRIIGCSLIQVEKKLFKYYNILKIDKLIDGYFGWEGVFRELRLKKVEDSKFIHTVASVDTSFFFPISEAETEKAKLNYGLPPDKLIIGWVGRISYDMQIKYTIDMCRVLLDQGFQDFHLLIVGGGIWFDEMKVKLEENNLTDKSTLTNWVHPSEVNVLLNCMDVVPLLEEDPHGGSIVREAMACAKVALSVNGESGTQATFMKNGSSILVEPKAYLQNAAEEIKKLYNAPEIRKEIGINARYYAETYLSFKSQVDIILNCVEKQRK